MQILPPPPPLKELVRFRDLVILMPSWLARSIQPIPYLPPFRRINRPQYANLRQALVTGVTRRAAFR
jgi:hypothetical protein